jgi:hypothetical protein
MQISRRAHLRVAAPALFLLFTVVAGLGAAALLTRAPEADAAPAGVERGTQVRTGTTGSIARVIPDGFQTVAVPVPGAYAPCTSCELPPVADVDVAIRASASPIHGASFTIGDATVFRGEDADGDTGPATGNDLGTGPADCTGTPTVFDDQAPAWWGAGATPPYAGTFRPTQSARTGLAALNGTDSPVSAGLMHVNAGYSAASGDGPPSAMTLHCITVTLRVRDWVYLPTPWNFSGDGKPPVLFGHEPALFTLGRFNRKDPARGAVARFGAWKGWGAAKATAHVRIKGGRTQGQGAFYATMTATGMQRCANDYWAYTRLSWRWLGRTAEYRPTGAFARDTRRNYSKYC